MPISLQKAEAREMMKGVLKFKGYKHNPSDSLKKFLYKSLLEYIHKYETVSESERVQCHIGARRSYGDLFRLCRYYYPNCGMDEIIQILTEDIVKDIYKIPKVNYITSFCGTIKKQTHRFEKNLYGECHKVVVHNTEMENEYGWKHDDTLMKIKKYK